MKTSGGMKRSVLISTVGVFSAVALAIMIKSLLPAEVNVDDFDSMLVTRLGFPLVAVLYFIIVYAHSIIVMQYFGRQSSFTKKQIGSRFGSVFAALYFFGMQEVVVEASPFDEWGLPFVRYQFIIGITDALPVLLLCMTVAYWIFRDKKVSPNTNQLNKSDCMIIVASVTVTFLLQRTIGYETGLVNSNAGRFSLPVYSWTALFGVVLGTSYVLLYPLFNKPKGRLKLPFQIAVLTIGLNWILFNSFIGLIFQGVMGQMLLRTGMDVAVFFATVQGVQIYLDKGERHSHTAKT